ncbi:MAG: hypothetical protein DRP22_02940 [Verrucomicrobia bacterium]|nr:MAG: hypothetical protein DRP22_02940 [Verrucomicrobiota bacterium]
MRVFSGGKEAGTRELRCCTVRNHFAAVTSRYAGRNGCCRYRVFRKMAMRSDLLQKSDPAEYRIHSREVPGTAVGRDLTGCAAAGGEG